MKNWKQILVPQGATIQEALINIDQSGTQIVLVVDAQGRLLGTLSDGDIRRGLLKGLTLSDKVESCMCENPLTAQEHEHPEAALSLMRRRHLHHMPIINARREVIGLHVIDEYFMPQLRNNWVVLMAGGLGTRLGDLVKATPKPMLNVGDRPLLETIVSDFMDKGFYNFYFAVNYMADVIIDHFGDGSRLGANIRYLRENKRMGTAGALSMLPQMPSEPFFVANGDLLAHIDYAHMLESHMESQAEATMGVSEYEYQVPYGVIRHENGVICHIDEKPVQRELISAGVYVLSPSALAYVPHDTFFDMPELFSRVITGGGCARCYNMQGYWLDIGHRADYQKANKDYSHLCSMRQNQNPAQDQVSSTRPYLVKKKPAKAV